MKCISDAVQLYKVPNFSAMVGKVLKQIGLEISNAVKPCSFFSLIFRTLFERKQVEYNPSMAKEV